jgi:cell division protease FtsH
MNSSTSGDHAHSEQTAREIDLEVKKVIDDCMKSAADILRDRADILEHMTRELLEVEVMNDQHIKRILDSHKTGPQVMPGTFVAESGTKGPTAEEPSLDEQANDEPSSAEGR